MSGMALEYVMERACSCSSKARLVGLCIAHHTSNTTGRCFPGQERLAKVSGLSERSVRDGLKELEAKGLISRHERRRDDQTYQSHEYELIGFLDWQDKARVLAKNQRQILPVDPEATGKNCKKPPADSAAKQGSNKPNTLKGEDTASVEAGAEAPSMSSVVWKDGLEVLSFQSQNSGSKNRKLIGSWLKRAGTSDEAKTKLLAIIRAARAAGTRDPVSYIAKSVNETFPNPSSWSTDKWQRILTIVVERGKWDASLGPEPGRKGCHVPVELISTELKAALTTERQAA